MPVCTIAFTPIAPVVKLLLGSCATLLVFSPFLPSLPFPLFLLLPRIVFPLIQLGVRESTVSSPAGFVFLQLMMTPAALFEPRLDSFVARIELRLLIKLCVHRVPIKPNDFTYCLRIASSVIIIIIIIINDRLTLSTVIR